MTYQDYVNEFNTWLVSMGLGGFQIADGNPADSPYFSQWVNMFHPGLVLTKPTATNPTGTATPGIMGMSQTTLLLVAGGLGLLLFMPKKRRARA